MRKLAKKYIILTVVFSVFAASLLCCCLTGVSHANSTNVQTETAEKHCHSDASETAKSTDSEDCECEQITAILDAKGFDSLNSKLSLAKFGDDLFSLSDSFSEIVEEKIILTEHSPPDAYKSATPLYLEFSVLRI